MGLRAYARRVQGAESRASLGDRRGLGVFARLWLLATVIAADGIFGVLRGLERGLVWSARQLPPTLSDRVRSAYEIRWGRRL